MKINAELDAKLDQLAARLGEPKSTIMRMAMRVGLAALEKLDGAEIVRQFAVMNQPPPSSKYPEADIEDVVLLQEKPGPKTKSGHKKDTGTAELTGEEQN